MEAVREQFGHLSGIEIEIEYAHRHFQPDVAAQDELSRLISSWEAADRCGVTMSTIRVWVHRDPETRSARCPECGCSQLIYCEEVNMHHRLTNADATSWRFGGDGDPQGNRALAYRVQHLQSRVPHCV